MAAESAAPPAVPSVNLARIIELLRRPHPRCATCGRWTTTAAIRRRGWPSGGKSYSLPWRLHTAIAVLQALQPQHLNLLLDRDFKILYIH